MQQIIARFLKRVTEVLEFVISIILAIGIVLLCFRMIGAMSNIPNLEVWPNYDDLLETCFNLIIGVELIRMMYYHTPDTVFEVCHRAPDYHRPLFYLGELGRRHRHCSFICHTKIPLL